jgi:hypothetical protein
VAAECGEASAEEARWVCRSGGTVASWLASRAAPNGALSRRRRGPGSGGDRAGRQTERSTLTPGGKKVHLRTAITSVLGYPMLDAAQLSWHELKPACLAGATQPALAGRKDRE